MSCNGLKRITLTLVLGVLVVGIAACGGSDDSESTAATGGGGTGGEAAAATAGPDEATKSAAIRDAEQKLAALRQTAGELRKRAELDGVADDASIQQGHSGLDRQISDAESKIASMKTASGEGWATAESGSKSSLSSADQAAGQLQSQIRTVRDARRADAIAALQTMHAMGLVMGLDGEEYEAYKKSVIATTQDQLSQLGLYDGPSDGWLEETTQRALAALQEQNGLGQSGIPTPKTRRILSGGGMGDEDDA